MFLHQIPAADTNRFAVLYGTDGVYEIVWGTAPNMDEAKRGLKRLARQQRVSTANLAIADRTHGTLVSYIL